MTIWAAMIAALPLGLVTSIHCVGMCGTMVLAVGGAFDREGAAASPRKGWAPHIAYHLGRLITYFSLGAAAGAAGSYIDRVAGMAGFHHATMVLSIMVLAVVALHLLGLFPLPGAEGEGGRASQWLATILRGVSGVPGAFTLGVLTGFLPCGPLYGALALAVASESPASGAAAMAAFWAGTAPLLLVLGQSGRVLIARLRGRAGAVMGLLVLGVAISVIAFKLSASTAADHGGHCGSHSDKMEMSPEKTHPR